MYLIGPFSFCSNLQQGCQKRHCHLLLNHLAHLEKTTRWRQRQRSTARQLRQAQTAHLAKKKKNQINHHPLPRWENPSLTVVQTPSKTTWCPPVSLLNPTTPRNDELSLLFIYRYFHTWKRIAHRFFHHHHQPQTTIEKSTDKKLAEKAPSLSCNCHLEQKKEKKLSSLTSYCHFHIIGGGRLKVNAYA